MGLGEARRVEPHEWIMPLRKRPERAYSRTWRTQGQARYRPAEGLSQKVSRMVVVSDFGLPSSPEMLHMSVLCHPVVAFATATQTAYT